MRRGRRQRENWRVKKKMFEKCENQSSKVLKNVNKDRKHVNSWNIHKIHTMEELSKTKITEIAKVKSANSYPLIGEVNELSDNYKI